jgi:hypothetical protein
MDEWVLASASRLAGEIRNRLLSTVNPSSWKMKLGTVYRYLLGGVAGLRYEIWCPEI